MALFCLLWENNSVDNLFRTITYLRSVIVRELQQSLCHHRSSWMLLHISIYLVWHSWHSIAIWRAGGKKKSFMTHQSWEHLARETQNWGRWVFLKCINKFVLRINILFLLLWLNFSFSPLHCFQSGELLVHPVLHQTSDTWRKAHAECCCAGKAPQNWLLLRQTWLLCLHTMSLSFPGQRGSKTDPDSRSLHIVLGPPSSCANVWERGLCIKTEDYLHFYLCPNLEEHLSSGTWTRARTSYDLASFLHSGAQGQNDQMWAAMSLQVSTGAAPASIASTEGFPRISIT